ncbi:DUF1543 domain-containing protein [Dyadobacter frigoris]|uniref:DUF1543 domain-containing protein n=1 Tax=Dyadobacter frigoris TaxID=2576211 RepID=A0A4U6D7W9_9BACT|nr:DUF1543 domain-containing protein [Dyadobacter frigoris]TKT92401.1 DUF1543 domain-containing protein [Dyadobacter frigoris]GLU53590.1 hypothetical protein Dfri01_30510 [Dyadobacter frigoris]
MSKLKLYMILLGCRPPGRFTEQHDIFFGIGKSVKDLLPEIIKSWPEAKGQIHLDAFQEVNYVNGYGIEVLERDQPPAKEENLKLFFINLGGYKKGEFDEFHYKTLVVAEDQSAAIRLSKQTAFYKHTGFKGAPSHVDDKYGIDVDDIFQVQEILAPAFVEKYHLNISKEEGPEDEIRLGYFPLKKIADEF